MHWTKRLRRAWKANPRTIGSAPKALPQLVTCPKRVIPVWQGEIKAAYPNAEVMVIEDYRDVKKWMDRCANSLSETVIAIVSHSKATDSNTRWRPALIERTRACQVPDLNPPDAMRDACQEITDREGNLVMYMYRDKPLTKEASVSNFYCPDCGALQTGIPRSYNRPEAETDSGTDSLEAAAAEEDAQVAIDSRYYFESKPRRCCACKAPLWQVCRSPAREKKWPQVDFRTWSSDPEQAAGYRPTSFSPFDYLERFYAGCYATLIVDESHNGRGQNTDIGHAFHLAQQASQMTIFASGTHFGGELLGFFFYWFRFNPQFWRKTGMGWEDADRAIRRYGIIEQITKERETEASRCRGETVVTVSTKPAPGISSRLLPSLLNDLVFIDVLDVGAAMPPRVEIPIIVSMHDYTMEDVLLTAQEEYEECDEQEKETKQINLNLLKAWAQERDLAQAYRSLTEQFRQLVEDRNPAATLQQGTLPKLWSILPFAKMPYRVCERKRDDWGEVQAEQTLIIAPQLAEDYTYPIERQLIRTISDEQAEGRSVMIFVEQTTLRSTPERLRWVLQQERVWVLPDSTPAEERQDKIIAAYQQGERIIIAPYKKVSEGLNLQILDTIIWYEMAQNLFMLDQASRRIWRLGATNEKRIIYLAYADTPGHKKLLRLGMQSGAAALFSGNTPEGELAKYAGADQTMIARMSRAMQQHENIDLKAAFARRATELETQLKRGREFIGTTDTLAERIAAMQRGGTSTSQPQRVERSIIAPAPGFTPVYKAIRIEPKRKQKPALTDSEAVIVEQFTFL